MTNQRTEWQQFIGDYAIADAEYQAAREVAAGHSITVERMTAAFLAEQQARDKLVSLRGRMYSRPGPAAVGTDAARAPER